MDYPEVSADKTHHIFNGIPIYQNRFTTVRAYQFPGLAAVTDDTGAYHIDFFGNPVYPERYARAGDYADSTAVVQKTDGSFIYIDETGVPISSDSFVWGSGFSDGTAAVYHQTNGATHITTAGELLYNDWYLDVRPFSGGKALVRDETGWFFIDRSGTRLENADEPSDSFPRGTVRRRHAENRIAELAASREYDACVILIRHAEREPFRRGEPGSSKNLTERGKAQAEALAHALPPIRAAYASPMPRCMQTASLIAGKPAAASKMLGDPGAFIFDNALSHEFYCRTSTVAAIRSYIEGASLPGHYPITEGAERMLSYLKSTAEDRGVVLCVTHDAFAVSLIAVLTGADFSNDWLDFLDGCILFCKNGNWTLVWRGGEQKL